MVIYDHLATPYEIGKDDDPCILDGQSGHLFNTGYRRSYHKSDKVESVFFRQEYATRKSGHTVLSLSVQVPQDVSDIEHWLLSMLKRMGFESLEDILPSLSFPTEKASVMEQKEATISEVETQENFPYIDLIRQIVILSKCNHVGYDPQSPMIFSHKRINRSIKLVTINLKEFYELD